MKKLICLFLFLAMLCPVLASAEAVKEEASVYDVSPVLCNPSPSAEAQELMNWMCENYGTRMISGQYLDEGRRGQELEAIAGVTGGLYPAMIGLDMMNYSPSSVSLGARPVTVDQALDYWKAGYLVTFCWHWRPDRKYMDTTGTSWWGGFYTENTTFSLEKAMNGEDPEGYDLLIRDMDAIAAQLQRLRDADVPVLWRPLHEASGGWFWWGASGAEPYIKLYRLMYDRFTNEFGLNNLIWVWNGQNRDWYPGDDVVDIIGEDIYPGKHAHDTQATAFERCLGYTGARKIILLSECGCVPSTIKCVRDNVVWGGWCVWCYEFVLDDQGNYSEEYTTAELLKRFYESERSPKTDCLSPSPPALSPATCPLPAIPSRCAATKPPTRSASPSRSRKPEITRSGSCRPVSAATRKTISCWTVNSSDRPSSRVSRTRKPTSVPYAWKPAPTS